MGQESTILVQSINYPQPSQAFETVQVFPSQSTELALQSVYEQVNKVSVSHQIYLNTRSL